MPNSLAKIHDRERRTLPTHSTQPPQTKFSRTCNPDIQKSLYCRTHQPKQKLPGQFLVQVATALPTHLEPPPSVTDQPKTLRLRPAPRRLRLQPNAFNFNHTPLAPPGTKIIIHNKPEIRGSWATRGYEGWYIGPASNHYRCHTVYANHTAHERVSETVDFSPHYEKMPYRSSTENSTIAACELTHALQNPTPASPLSNIRDKQM